MVTDLDDRCDRGGRRRGELRPRAVMVTGLVDRCNAIIVGNCSKPVKP